MTDLLDHVLHSVAGQFSDETDSKTSDVRRILDRALAASPAKGLLLHFHGGLVTKANGLEIADKLTPVYKTVNTYPVFFVWESGLFESLLNNKVDLLNDPAFRELVKKVSEWVLKRIGGSAVFKGGPGQTIDVDKLRKEYDDWFDQQREAPPVPEGDVSGQHVRTKGSDTISVDELAEDIETGFDNDPQFRKAMEEAYNAQLPQDAVATKGAGSRVRAQVMLLSDEARERMFPQPSGATTKGGILSWIAIAKFVAKIVLAVLKRYRNQRAHGVYCTIVEEVLRSAYASLIGSAVWNQMKKDTADSFQTGSDFCGTEVVRCLQTLEASGMRFNQLTLVGHSTGAIYICHFLDAAAKAGLITPIKVIFLAPAVTHSLFAAAVRDHGTTRLKQFRLFGMVDALESEDRMLGIIYTRSLLYFVSGLLEGDGVDKAWKPEIDMPIGGMQRYLKEPVFTPDAFPDVHTVAAFLSADATRTVWSPAGGAAGLSSQSKRHSDFDDDLDTLKSVQSFI